MSEKNNEIFIETWIDKENWKVKDFKDIETPTYVVSLPLLEKNLRTLKEVQDKTGAKILLALKSFSMFKTFPLCREYLSGAEASSVNEARLGYEKFGKEVHTFSPSYTKEDIGDYIKYSDHLVFNSFSQWNRFKDLIIKSKKKISAGIRVNLEHSEIENPMYDPSNSESRFGVTLANFEGQNLNGLEGIHFHNLCESSAEALERSLKVFEEKFGKYLNNVKWVNFGGGHHITRKDYNLNLLEKIIKEFKEKYPHLSVYLEPGEAIALNAGVLVGKVTDIFKNNKNIAVIDISPSCHMPDVIEMPYLPTILEAENVVSNDSKYTYKLVGPSCLAGDIIGEYSFKQPLQIGQRLVFMNMAIYTMVKNNTFNGINLPNIAVIDKNAKIKIVKKFGYKDFKERLS